MTAKGAVLIPVLVLLIALAFSVAGLYTFYKDYRELAVSLGAISGVVSTIAIFRLYKTITAVEYGALSPERTVEFETGFRLLTQPNYLDTLEITAGVKTPYNISARSEYDIENFEMRLFIPKEVQLASTECESGIVATTYADGTIMSFSKECLYKGFGVGVMGVFTSAATGKYLVNVTIRAKGVYAFEKELFIVVK